jgi:hypothetical protein
MKKKHTYELTLPVKLTEEQVADRAQKLAAIEPEIRSVIEGKKQAAAEYKSRETALEATRDTLARQVRERSEMQRVECERRLDGRDVVETRLDTGDEVSRRRATPEESQGELAWPGATPGDEP